MATDLLIIAITIPVTALLTAGVLIGMSLWIDYRNRR